MKRLLYIWSSSAISALNSFDNNSFLDEVHAPLGEIGHASLPDYNRYLQVPGLRRMSKVVRMGVCSALHTLRQAHLESPDRIIVGTGVGCIEDTEKFISTIYHNNENLGSPNQFIQSTHNNVASQIALLLGCDSYNFTYAHRGFSFESTLFDAFLEVERSTQPLHLLVGGVDEITDIYMDVWRMLERARKMKYVEMDGVDVPVMNRFGEGACFFLLSDEKRDARVAIRDVDMIYKPTSADEVKWKMQEFISRQQLTMEDIDLLVVGYPGGTDPAGIWKDIVGTYVDSIPIVRYKEGCGEYKTSSSYGLWLTYEMLLKQKIKSDWTQNTLPHKKLTNALILSDYNYSNLSMMLVSYV